MVERTFAHLCETGGSRRVTVRGMDKVKIWYPLRAASHNLVRGFGAFSNGAVRSCVTRKPMSTDIARAYCAPYNSWANRIAVHRFVQDIPVKQGDRGYELVTQVSKTLGRLDHLPVFIGWGEKDFVFDDFFLQEWLQRFPNAELHRYPDCGHYVLEDAGLELVPLISTFLESHPL